jgi:hypothetical protein
MTKQTTNLEACTDDGLEQALARLLAQARGEVLNDGEVQQYLQLYKEIERRRAPAATAAYHPIMSATVVDFQVQTKCPTCGRPCGADELSECLRCGQLYCSNDSWNCGCDTDARESMDRTDSAIQSGGEVKAHRRTVEPDDSGAYSGFGF